MAAGGRLAALRKRSDDVRFLLDLPGLALGEQFLEVADLAFARRAILLDDRAFEGRCGIVEEHAERHREAGLRHLDEHVRKPAVGLIVDDDARGLPVAIDDIDHLERQVRDRSEEHTSELQSLMRISYAVFCLKKKTHKTIINT